VAGIRQFLPATARGQCPGFGQKAKLDGETVPLDQGGIELFREKTKRNNSGGEQKTGMAIQLLKFKRNKYM
jgi:hypothetical protein